MGEESNENTYTPPASQADLDRIVEQRLSRERSKYADYDDLKAKAAKFDEADAAAKSELQKALDAIAERDTKLAELPNQIRRQVVRFASQATQAGFIDAEDALSFLPGDLNLDDNDAVKAALDSLAERKPHLVKKAAAVKERPKPKKGESADTGGEDELEGKERAAAALRQFRTIR